MPFVDNLDDKEYLTGLFHAMFDELPSLKPRKKKMNYLDIYHLDKCLRLLTK